LSEELQYRQVLNLSLHVQPHFYLQARNTASASFVEMPVQKPTFRHCQRNGVTSQTGFHCCAALPYLSASRFQFVDIQLQGSPERLHLHATANVTGSLAFGPRTWDLAQNRAKVKPFPVILLNYLSINNTCQTQLYQDDLGIEIRSVIARRRHHDKLWLQLLRLSTRLCLNSQRCPRFHPFRRSRLHKFRTKRLYPISPLTSP